MATGRLENKSRVIICDIHRLVVERWMSAITRDYVIIAIMRKGHR
jgi:hypothetical protein